MLQRHHQLAVYDLVRWAVNFGKYGKSPHVLARIEDAIDALFDGEVRTMLEKFFNEE